MAAFQNAARKLLMNIKEHKVGFRFGGALNDEGQFAPVVVAPHGRFAAGHVLPGWDVVPAARAVIDRVQN